MIWRGIAALVLILAAVGMWRHPEPEWRFEPPAAATLGTGVHFETVFSYTSPAGTAHAPALQATEAGFDLFWFDGTRESDQDVRILGVSLPGGDIAPMMSRHTMSDAMTPPQRVLVLGNTISDKFGGHIAVVVSAGGWAAASLARVDDRAARKLSLSPILNRSHLAKSPVLKMSQGQTLVPAYFEMGGGYGVSALLDADFRVRGQSVMRGETAAIQPMIVPTSDTDAVAIFRRFDKQTDRLLASWTETGGKTWTTPAPLTLPNPDAPVAAVTLDDGRILMLYNDAPDHADTLRFALSEDGGRTWVPGRLLDGPGKGSLRYPMMVVLTNGNIAATYSTGTKAGIIAHEFSADWAVQP